MYTRAALTSVDSVNKEALCGESYDSLQKYMIQS